MMRLNSYAHFLATRTPNVRERIERLNPAHGPGERLRGYHINRQADNDLKWQYGCFSRKEVIEKYGRAAWDWLPKSAIRHAGKRKYATRESVLDKLWHSNQLVHAMIRIQSDNMRAGGR